MPYTRKIVCLANSRRPGGYCFAGKEVTDTGGYGQWIRPISIRESEEISEIEQALATGERPQLLDVVAIPLLEPKPYQHQRENHLIHDLDNGGQPWELVGQVDEQQLPQLLDNVSDVLWVNEDSPTQRYGKNDRIAATTLETVDGSLLLIQPESMTFIVDYEQHIGAFKGSRRRPDVRADFCHNGHNYRLKVTDMETEYKYQRKSLDDKNNKGAELPNEYSVAVDNMYLCVSIARLDHYGYKIVAAVIGDND